MKRLFISISKGEALRFLGHLDFLRALERAIMRAHVPIAFSEGFNPHMKLALDAALGVGVTADPLYMELVLEQELKAEEFHSMLAPQLPQGITIRDIREADASWPKLVNFFTEDCYEMEGPLYGEADALQAKRAAASFNELDSFLYKRITPKKVRELDVKPMLLEPARVEIKNDRAFLSFSLIRSQSGSIQPKDLWKLLSESFGLPWRAGEFICTRTGTFHRDGGKRYAPFDKDAFSIEAAQ